MEIDNQILLDNFKCPICLEIVEEPWETSCCGNLFCEKCILSYMSNQCPICRTKNFKTKKNNFAKLLIKEYEGNFSCPHGCNKKIKLNEFKEHKYNCDDVIFKCNINKCKFEGKRKNSLEHLINCHEDTIALLSENFESLKNVFQKIDIFEKLIKEDNKNNDINISEHKKL